MSVPPSLPLTRSAQPTYIIGHKNPDSDAICSALAYAASPADAEQVEFRFHCVRMMLVAAFRATLEEVIEADVILHVRDIANPDTEQQRADVRSVLKDLDIDLEAERYCYEVLNKIDSLPDEQRIAVRQRTESTNEPVVAVSAITGEGIEQLTQAIARLLGVDDRVCGFVLDLSDGAAFAWLYAHGEMIERTDEPDGTAAVSVRLSASDADRFTKRFAGSIRRGDA